MPITGVPNLSLTMYLISTDEYVSLTFFMTNGVEQNNKNPLNF